MLNCAIFIHEKAGISKKYSILAHYPKFIQNSANYMITFARLAIKQLSMPYTNNLIEQLVGEIAKRVKEQMDTLEHNWTRKPTQHTPR